MHDITSKRDHNGIPFAGTLRTFYKTLPHPKSKKRRASLMSEAMIESRVGGLAARS
jgi:hypothetical protein